MSIPLTFDWVTLAWLELRLALWWKSRRGETPWVRLRQLLLLLGLGALSGCVPVTRFEETQSAAQVEMAARHRAEYELARLTAENAELHAQLRAQSATLSQSGDALAQAELDKSTQGKERADAEGMVEQLRGELARVGGHLQAYHADKQQLQASLASEASRGRALALLARDVTLALADPLGTGEYELDAERGYVVLSVAREKLLAEDGTLRPEAAGLSRAVARVLQLHPQSKLRVEDGSAPGDAIAAARAVAALAVPAERIEPLAVTAEGAAAQPAAGIPSVKLAFSAP